MPTGELHLAWTPARGVLHVPASMDEVRAVDARVEGDRDMLRLLHLADVHLGARHPELGAAGEIQRERQFQAFERAMELAVSERCAVVVVAGDLFDSNAQPRRSVERAARAMAVAVAGGAVVAILPGDSDPYDVSSLYRTYDLAALAGIPETDGIHVLEPGSRTLVLPSLDVAVRAYVGGDDTSLDDALREPRDEAETGVRLRVGVAHLGGEAVPPTEEALEAAGLDYLALGGTPGPAHGAAGSAQWADPGPLESLARSADARPTDAGSAGQALLVVLDPGTRGRTRIEARVVGRTRRVHLELGAADFTDDVALADHLRTLADPDLACDLRLVGQRPPDLRIDEASLETRLAPSFLHLRVVDATLAPPPGGPTPPAESIAGAFIADVRGRMDRAIADERSEDARELGEELELGTRLLAGSTGMPV
jgi:hypothetical protein